MTTKEDHTIHSYKDIFKNNNSEQNQKPFQIVLVDIKKAVQEEIHCVEKPLVGTEDLKFVALSYRWGELHETMVDTQVGYSAVITSFGLNDFFALCQAIAVEDDLKHMEYVWVDAICIDQTNPSKRKATIYQMTNIYQRANYILAVPDLHLRYLINSSQRCRNIINYLANHREYVYLLIQGNMEKLVECDERFLDDIETPKDRRLRHLLINYTPHFALGLTTCKHEYIFLQPNTVLKHVYKTNPVSCTPSSKLDWPRDDETSTLDTLSMDELHLCNMKDPCPLQLLEVDMDSNNYVWKSYLTSYLSWPICDYDWKLEIPERSRWIRESFAFLNDLIKDWSSRAWVISEYHLAKSKNNGKMKYWFFQLGSRAQKHGRFQAFPSTQRLFFEFDFNQDPSVSQSCLGGNQTTCTVACKLALNKDVIYRSFHATMRKQLSQPTFLEKILKSNASKNEDRFHAILPSSEYKHILVHKDQVDDWHITTLTSVKLKLYQWMTIKHKLELLFLSSLALEMPLVFPTFATACIDWPAWQPQYPNFDNKKDDHFTCNFDLTNPSTIRLSRLDNDDNDFTESLYKINVKPKEYYYRNMSTIIINKQTQLHKLLSLPPGDDDWVWMYTLARSSTKNDDPSRMTNDIPNWSQSMSLRGSLAKNKWVVMPAHHLTSMKLHPHIDGDLENWDIGYCDENNPGFDIY